MAKQKFSRREIFNFFTHLFVGGYLSARVGLLYATLVETEWIEISHIELVLKRLPADFHGYKIAQISDIHFDDWMTPQRFSKIVDMVNQEDPDAIVITGDIIYRNHEEYESGIVAQFNRFQATDGVFGIHGNHDHWLDPEFVTSLFEQSGIINLNNRVNIFSRDSSRLHLCGLDDYWERKNNLDAVIEILPQDECAVLLVHEPDYADISAPTGRFDLQLSGHSHGGQVNIPFIGPPIVPDYAIKYPSGLYKILDMYLYTNRGVGMIRPRIRLNCRPEISIFHLHSPEHV